MEKGVLEVNVAWFGDIRVGAVMIASCSLIAGCSGECRVESLTHDLREVSAIVDGSAQNQGLWMLFDPVDLMVGEPLLNVAVERAAKDMARAGPFIKKVRQCPGTAVDGGIHGDAPELIQSAVTWCWVNAMEGALNDEPGAAASYIATCLKLLNLRVARTPRTEYLVLSEFMDRKAEVARFMYALPALVAHLDEPGVKRVLRTLERVGPLWFQDVLASELAAMRQHGFDARLLTKLEHAAAAQGVLELSDAMRDACESLSEESRLREAWGHYEEHYTTYLSAIYGLRSILWRAQHGVFPDNVQEVASSDLPALPNHPLGVFIADGLWFLGVTRRFPTTAADALDCGVFVAEQ